MALSQRAKNLQATGLFKQYVFRLVFRTGVAAYAVYLFVVHPELLNMSEYFGLVHGFNSVDFFFLCILTDVLSKFFPEASISMGSLKQFGKFYVPTFKAFPKGREGFKGFVLSAIRDGKTAVVETAEGLMDTAKQVHRELNSLLRDINFLRTVPFESESITADEELLDKIRRDRVKEIVPVIIFWVVANVALGLVLNYFGVLDQATILLWTLAFFVIDMICVVFWCPFQVLMMRNRCCTTCQIFNWDAIMTTTPLLLVFFDTSFAWILVLLSLVVLIRWELAFVRHPERFDDRTNASLRCANCSDKLCYLRAPLEIKR